MKNSTQQYPPAERRNTENPFVVPLLSQFSNQQIADLGITGTKTDIKQIPTEDNGNTAVCTGEISTSKGTFSGTGIATPDMVGDSTHPHTLIHAAEADALNIPFQMALNTISSAETIDVTPRSQQNSAQQNQNNFRHSSNKPMSAKQRAMIEGLATNQRTTGDAVAQDIAGKPLNKLTSSEAHQVISKLKN